jgi:hypothetical protein
MGQREHVSRRSETGFFNQLAFRFEPVAIVVAGY